MKNSFMLTVVATGLISFHLSAQTNTVGNKDTSKQAPTNLYMDVHHLGPGKVKAADVAAAHQKDLAVEKKFGVNFIDYWVDEKAGNVYCLSTAPDSMAIRNTHALAHGLLPDQVYLVQSGQMAPATTGKKYFLDIHYLGAGKVTAKDVAAAHLKDLAVEKKHGVNFINYWVNEKSGTVMCLSQAPDSAAVVETHREAHGLLPASVKEVKQ
jgi:hypothetical protein